jgi:hypothetical protein
LDDNFSIDLIGEDRFGDSAGMVETFNVCFGKGSNPAFIEHGLDSFLYERGRYKRPILTKVSSLLQLLRI